MISYLVTLFKKRIYLLATLLGARLPHHAGSLPPGGELTRRRPGAQVVPPNGDGVTIPVGVGAVAIAQHRQFHLRYRVDVERRSFRAQTIL